MAERVRNSVNKRHVDAASGEIIGQPPAVHTPGSKALAATLPESGADKQNRRLDCVNCTAPMRAQVDGRRHSKDQYPFSGSNHQGPQYNYEE